MFDNRLFISFSATDSFPECDYSLKYVVRRAISATLAYEGFPCDAEVSVTFCDNEYIKKINSQFRDKDSATDVLSFPMYDFDDEDDFPVDPNGSLALGDIVISLERAAEQAREIGNSFHREVAFLAIHSTLHLLGYDHERSEDDEEAQCLAQREIIETIKI
ncbi:MAG: rRNA maturation RNase YbeY [Clostridia bacterium]|nr:rRNA maturation RNase YbeY [Clostridia bacterium]